MAKVLIDILKELLDNIDKPINDEDLLRYIIRNGIVLDNLTNGEVLMKMYGISQDGITYVDALVPYALIKSDKLWSVELMVIPLDWWNRKWGE